MSHSLFCALDSLSPEVQLWHEHLSFCKMKQLNIMFGDSIIPMLTCISVFSSFQKSTNRIKTGIRRGEPVSTCQNMKMFHFLINVCKMHQQLLLILQCFPCSLHKGSLTLMWSNLCKLLTTLARHLPLPFSMPKYSNTVLLAQSVRPSFSSMPVILSCV